ncbi:hypothetical protein [Streptomyces caniscabiei]|uniref:Uncharacterized protein n=1 Tax=Streptomyces caniscabiei TaxID=2746961 RepID=A0ABU4MIX9_9ACTN|nr:hypothetical protein [Streptomyces caniscabiei]MBE4791031.1 hypothetical protein [Streptomyces caniscabiei]MDX3009660.1 hypothetical protein [Streptomyces caniscabiei]MDX3037305.1 hypothetical protein [Streptomyces caniscabiei]
MSPPSTTELAKTAYAAYGNSTGHRNFMGHPMPDWDELTPAIRLAWVEAAGAVALTNIAELSGITTPSTDPSVGDIVLVPMDRSINNGATAAPAVVTRAWSPTTVNVRVLADSDAAPSWRTSVTFVETLDHVDSSAAVWTWPGGDD